MGWVGPESVEGVVDEAKVAFLCGFITDQQEMQRARCHVREGVEAGLAEIPSMSALVDGDDPMPFMVKAADLDEARVVGVVQAGEVTVLEVGEGRGEFVRGLLLIGSHGAPEFRRRHDVPFKGRHDTFQFGIQSSLG
jgi:hypothetical protein